MSNYVLIIWTCKNAEEARHVAKGLLTERLIACASIVPVVESFFHWEGKIDQATESKVFLKTTASHFKAIKDYILTHCSYQVPEILAIPIQEGHEAYLSWIKEETK